MFRTKLTVYRLPHCPPDQLIKGGDELSAGYDIRAAEDKVIYPPYLMKEDLTLNLSEWQPIGYLHDFSTEVQQQIQHMVDVGIEDIKIDTQNQVLQLFYKPQLIKTGIVISYDTLSWSLLTTRSSVGSKQLLSMPHGVGVIDYMYKGPKDELLISFTSSDVRVIRKGDRIAQLIPMSQYTVDMNTDISEVENDDYFTVNSLSSSSRGGFGSTGIN